VSDPVTPPRQRSNRPTIAYRPLFRDQVAASHVQEISSSDTGAIQGTFRKPVQVAGVSTPVGPATAVCGSGLQAHHHLATERSPLSQVRPPFVRHP